MGICRSSSVSTISINCDIPNCTICHCGSQVLYERHKFERDIAKCENEYLYERNDSLNKTNVELYDENMQLRDLAKWLYSECKNANIVLNPK